MQAENAPFGAPTEKLDSPGRFTRLSSGLGNREVAYVRIFLLALSVLLSGCIAAQSEVRDEASASVSLEKQLESGRQIYAQSCATSTCHGTKGKGLLSGDTFRVWPLIGSDFQERNPTAQVIFDIIRSGGEAELRALTDQQIYDSIAYTLSLNGVSLTEVLRDEDAAGLASGPASPAAEWGTIYPPPGNAIISTDPLALASPLRGENGELALQVNQYAFASAIAGGPPTGGGRYLVLVISFQVLAKEIVEIVPEFLWLEDMDGRRYSPTPVRLAYPIDPIHMQVIQPAHGTSMVCVFALPEDATPATLVYADQSSQSLTVNLR